MHQRYLVFSVGLWTLLLGGLTLWNLSGASESGGHELAENIGYAVAWLLAIAGTMTTHRLMQRREREKAQLAAGVAASEERWRAALDAVGDGVWDWDAQSNAVYYSPRWKSMLGFAEHEISARLDEWESRVHPDDRARTLAAVQRHVAGETPDYECEHRVQCKAGGYKWIRARGQVVSRASDGRALRVVGTHQDLTVQKLAETARLESEQRYRQLLGSITDYVFSVALKNGRPDATSHSPGCLAVTGYTMAEFAANPALWFELVPAAQAATVTEHWDAALRGERVDSLEHQIRHRDGSTRWVRGTLVPRCDEQGRLVALDGLVQDITERKQMESDLRASEARYRLIAENTGDVIWLFDFTAKRFSYVSPSVQKLSGFTPEETLTLGLQHATTRENFPQVTARLAARITALAAGDESARTRAYELPLPCKDGSIVDTEVVTTLITDPSGRVTHLQGVTRDISVRKRTEEALRESERMLRDSQELAALGSYVLDVPTGRWKSSAVLDEIFGIDATFERTIANWTLLIAPADRASVENYFAQEVIGHGVLFDRSYRIIRRNDGVERWVHGKGQLEFDAEHRPVRMIGTIQDITAHRLAEQELLDGKRELELFFNQSLDGFFFAMLDEPIAWNDATDKEAALDFVFARQHLVRANDALLAQYGATREQLVGRTPGSLMAGDVAAVRGLWRRLFDAGRLHIETDERRIDGTPLRIEGDYICLYDEAGRLTGHFGVQRDITARVRAETELRESRENYLGLFNTVSEAIYVHGPDGVFLDVNEGAARMYGCTREELVGQTPAAVAAPGRNELAAVGAMLGEVFATGRPAAFEFMGRRKNGEEFPKACVTHRGKYFGRDVLITTARDITAQRRAEASLRESEERYRKLIDLSPELVLVHVDGRIVFLNDAGAALLGAPAPSALLATPIMDRIPAELREFVAARIQAILRDGISSPLTEQKLLRLDGRAVDVVGVGTGINYEGRAAVLFLAHDVTGRRQAEDQLRKLSRAVEQSPVTVVITDTTGAIEYVNPSFTAKTGYTLAEARGANPRLLKSGEVSPEVYRGLWQTIKSGREWRGEFHNRKKNGEFFWESATISPITDEAGRITHFLAVKEDVTERRAAEDRIREQAALLDVTQDAILVLDLGRRITFWNRGAEKLYGVSRAEALGRCYETIAYREPPPDYDAVWRQILERGESSAERRQATRERGDIVVQKRSTVVRDDRGEARSVLMVVTDITDAKRLEAQFLRAQRLESLGSLASGVAHDLNNVLTPILMSAGVLGDSARTAHERELIRLVAESAKRGADIVQQLLLFGRGSDSPRSPMSVGAVVKDMGKMMRGTFPKGIALTVEVPQNLWLIDGDRTQIDQVVLNLCVNSRDAMPAGGRLAVRAENVNVDAAFAERHPGGRPGPHVVIRVTDTGAGIAPAHLEKIFDPFFSTKPTGQGTGLGLATVLGIVRSHGGFVIVESQEGLGSEFDVYLPARPSAVESVVAEQGRPKISGHGELVLVIDDEASIRSALARLFTARNYDVVVAGDGVEGVAVFVQHAKRIKLVITDVMMPVMDGMQAIRALRRLNPNLPVVAISGLPSQRAELEANFGPRIRFLSKPFPIDKALQLARELLDEAPPPATG